MHHPNEAALNQALRLLDEINGNPLHPVNDARRPEHAANLEAYRALEAWCQVQQLLIEQSERQARTFAGF